MPERVDRRAVARRHGGNAGRLLGAAACVLASPVFIAVIVIEGAFQSAIVGSLGLGAALGGLVWIWRADRVPSMAEMARQGLTEEVVYRATRCLQFEVPRDDNPLFLVELDSGEALCLGRKWLPGSERFPCTEFVAVRRKADREVIALRCSGIPLEIEAVKAFAADQPGLRLPASGDVLPAGAYEETKRHLPDGRCSTG
ncbi:MAG: hypothetical protein ABW221_02970 [Vicinamibacteria bacterium]